MKKFILVLFALSAFQIQTVIAFYDDVNEETPYYEEIKFLYENGKLPENSTNLFKPNDLLTKSFIYEMILSAARIPLNQEPNLPYSDTSNDAQYAKYLQTAIDLNIIKPSGQNSLFDPDLPLGKYSALQIFFNNLGVGVNPFVDPNFFPFSDVSATSYIAPVAQKAHEVGILDEENNDKFGMAKRIDRATSAHYLYLISLYLEKESAEIPTFEIFLEQGVSVETVYEEELLESEKFSDFAEIWSALKNEYLYKKEENIDGDKLISDAIKGMLTNIKDKYTTYEDPDSESSILDSISSEFEGIGIMIDLIGTDITIITPLKGSPAEKAGLKSNDIITAVDNEPVEGQTIAEISKKIKGPAGTNVKVTIKRDNQKLDFEITRGLIALTSTNYELMTNKDGKKVAYIELTSFSEKSYDEFKSAAEALIKDNPIGFVIDLRNNPGGYVDQALPIISLFTNEEKPIVTFVYPDGTKEKFRSDGNGLLNKYKTVILINEGSASASEIMAGALSDWERATIIGETSYGKGSVQELREYNDGSVFKFTTSKWLTPNYTDISKSGITPDETISNHGSSEDLQLKRALEKF